MLDDAVDAFLDAVGERAFDEPLMAMLRAEGFTDVRLVHGQAEFGKMDDFSHFRIIVEESAVISGSPNPSFGVDL